MAAVLEHASTGFRIAILYAGAMRLETCKWMTTCRMCSVRQKSYKSFALQPGDPAQPRPVAVVLTGCIIRHDS